MKRDYTTGTNNQVDFFVGTEIEQSPAYGKRTLFVVGIQSVDQIQQFAKEHRVEHIYFGANQSFDPMNSIEWESWIDMITALLNDGYLCTLDLDLQYVNRLTETKMSELTTFIPMISVKMPYVKLLNINTTVKIDDIGFNKTNPGVWCHSLSNLTNHKNFTDWSKYTTDQIIK